MAAFFAGAALVSVLGGPLLVGLVAGGALALGYRPLRRDPPWSARGRAAWRARAATWAEAWRAGAQLRRLWRGAARPVETDLDMEGATRVDPAAARAAARFDAAFRVRCEFVGDRFQVWHSTDTGRAYEVVPRDAPAQVAVGDEGWLSFEAGRPRVRPWAGPPQRVLN